MEKVMTDIWPYLMPPIFALIGWIFREIYQLKTRMVVLEKSSSALEEKMQTDIDNITKTIDAVQRRQDSHSKKQDAILDRISNMEKEVLGRMSDITITMTSLAGDLKSLTNLIAISDAGIKIKREK